MSYKEKILNTLLDSYEHSATFLGTNRVRQEFRADMGRLFPKYLDDAAYDVYVEVNEAVDELITEGLVRRDRPRRIDGPKDNRVVLVLDRLEDAYEALRRTPRASVQEEQKEHLFRIKEELYGLHASDESKGELIGTLVSYANAQLLRISQNKSVECYENASDYDDLWKLLLFLCKNEDEFFERDISIQLYGDSKRLAEISKKAEALLFSYGDYPKREQILEEYGILHTPTYVFVKGNVRISFGVQEIDVGVIPGGLAFSSESLAEITGACVYGKRIITIENLTCFHRYDCKDDAVAIYLGGFHNRAKREFLRKVHSFARDAEFLHFGDIDAGGFYIFEHLKKKTKIPFSTIYMDVETLQKYRTYAKPLSENDRKRLQRLMDTYGPSAEYADVVDLMLADGIKLEQEAVWE